MFKETIFEEKASDLVNAQFEERSVLNFLQKILASSFKQLYS